MRHKRNDGVRMCMHAQQHKSQLNDGFPENSFTCCTYYIYTESIKCRMYIEQCTPPHSIICVYAFHTLTSRLRRYCRRAERRRENSMSVALQSLPAQENI